MLRKQLADKGFNLSSAEFSMVMGIVTDDIKFNNIHFGKRTSNEDVLAIAVRTVGVLKRCS